MNVPTDNPPRIASLDALRGLAALTVVAHHCLIAFALFYGFYFRGFYHSMDKSPQLSDRVGYYLSGTPLHLLWGGLEAVILFFVLSGFVLALPFVRPGPAPAYGEFLIKRICRIYPPYLVSIGLAALARVGLDAALSRPDPRRLSVWFDSLWRTPLTLQTLVDHVAMFGDLSGLNSVVWSLTPEIRIAFAFPVIMWLLRRGQGAWLLPVCLVGSFVVIPASGWDPIAYALPRPLYDSLNWMQYVVYFVAGGLIACQRDRLAKAMAAIGPIGRSGVTLASLYALNIRWQFPHFELANQPIIGLGAVGLIVSVLYAKRWADWLNHPWLVALGRISYSVYLLHTTILMGCLYVLGPVLGQPLAVAVVPVATVVAAQGFYAWVEVPAMQWGRRWVMRRRARTAPSGG